MSFALPSAFFLCLLALPIVIFYIMKVRLRRVPVSTNLFWSQIYDEKPPRSIWQYFKHLLSLLLQLLLLLLLVLALADPYLPWQLQKARRVAVVIDNSASMQTADVDGQTRFEAAIDQAQDLVNGLRFRDEMTIILAGARPEVVLGMSSHGPTLKRTLGELKVSENPTDVEAAIELGKQLIGEHPSGEVVVYTDGCLPTDSLIEVESKPDTMPVENVAVEKTDTDQETKLRYQIVGSDIANVGITQFQVRRSLSDPLGYEVLVNIFNASEHPVNCRLELELDGVPVDVLPLKLEPEEHWSRSLEKTSIEGGQLVGMLTKFEGPTDKDSADSKEDKQDDSEQTVLNGLSIDDRAWAVLPERKTQNVLIVTPGNLFLQKVFEANPLVNVTVQKDFPEQWPAETLMVLHENVPEKLPPTDLLIIDPVNDSDGWTLGEELDNAIVTEMDAESPLMTHVRLDNVLMPAARKIKFLTETNTLAGVVSGDAIYSELERSAGKALVLNVNLQNSDLAFRTAFPIMVTNALGWYAGESGELRPSLATGNTTEATFDANQFPLVNLLTLSPPSRLTDSQQTPMAIQLPEESPSQSQTDNNSFETSTAIPLGPFAYTGIWSLGISGKSDPERSAWTLMEVAVNLANQRESDLRPLQDLQENRSQTVQLAGAFTRPFWFYLIVVACILTCVEWFAYQRRVIS